MAVARRLFLVVFTDFCCWFPVGLMGLLASRGTPIPGVLNVWTAIFVMPLNSAVNPFLYTLNTLRQRRTKRKMQVIIQAVMGKLDTEMTSWPKEKVEHIIQHGQRIIKNTNTAREL
nr:hypothetical protein BaRGS_011115 [Batillaria attramentaria]